MRPSQRPHRVSRCCRLQAIYFFAALFQTSFRCLERRVWISFRGYRGRILIQLDRCVVPSTIVVIRGSARWSTFSNMKLLIRFEFIIDRLVQIRLVVDSGARDLMIETADSGQLDNSATELGWMFHIVAGVNIFGRWWTRFSAFRSVCSIVTNCIEQFPHRKTYLSQLCN